MVPNLIGALMFLGLAVVDYFMLGCVKDRAIRT
jgi:hypothetical protein